MSNTKKQFRFFGFILLLLLLHFMPSQQHQDLISRVQDLHFQSPSIQQPILHATTQQKICKTTLEAIEWEEDDEQHNQDHRVQIKSKPTYFINPFKWMQTSLQKGSVIPRYSKTKEQQPPLYLLYRSWKSHPCA